MLIHELTVKVGRYKNRKRIGRGIGSGHGKTSGRGTKGAGSRSGWSRKTAREGGQMPFFRRIAKRGFSNAEFTVVYQVINVKALDARFENGAEVNPDMLVKVGLLSDATRPVKVLGEGKLTKKLNVTAAAFSEAAKEKILQAGGTATEAK